MASAEAKKNSQSDSKLMLGVKTIVALIVYSSAYLPTIIATAKGGYILQGSYAILRSAFDILVAAHTFGVSQSFFDLSRKYSYDKIMSFHHVAAFIASCVLTVIIYFASLDVNYFILVLSANLYSVFSVRRLIMLVKSDPILYQIINSALAFQISICILFCDGDYNRKISLYILFSVLVQALMTTLVLASKKYLQSDAPGKVQCSNSQNLTRWGRSIKEITGKSSLAFAYQFVQISFSFLIIHCMKKSGATLTQIGYFSVAYSICSVFYAPATVFGSNIVSYMYGVSGRISYDKLFGVLKLVALSTVSMIIIAGLGSRFQIFEKIAYGSVIGMVIIVIPILAGARLVVPIAIWMGHLRVLIYWELARISLALFLVVIVLNKSLEQTIIALALAETLFSTLCLVYLKKNKEKIFYVSSGNV